MDWRCSSSGRAPKNKEEEERKKVLGRGGKDREMWSEDSLCG
jgi:hypothetical protein